MDEMPGFRPALRIAIASHAVASHAVTSIAVTMCLVGCSPDRGPSVGDECGVGFPVCELSWCVLHPLRERFECALPCSTRSDCARLGSSPPWDCLQTSSGPVCLDTYSGESPNGPIFWTSCGNEICALGETCLLGHGCRASSGFECHEDAACPSGNCLASGRCGIAYGAACDAMSCDRCMASAFQPSWRYCEKACGTHTDCPADGSSCKNGLCRPGCGADCLSCSLNDADPPSLVCDDEFVQLQ